MSAPSPGTAALLVVSVRSLTSKDATSIASSKVISKLLGLLGPAAPGVSWSMSTAGCESLTLNVTECASDLALGISYGTSSPGSGKLSASGPSGTVAPGYGSSGPKGDP